MMGFLSLSLVSEEKGLVLYTFLVVSVGFLSVLMKLLTVKWTIFPLMLLTILSYWDYRADFS